LEHPRQQAPAPDGGDEVGGGLRAEEVVGGELLDE
jgi:hypothetical protein